MSILASIEKDFQEALKNQEKSLMSTLRLVLAVLKNEKIKKMADLTDEEIIKALRTEIKKRKEASEEYQKGNRSELAAKELDEIKIIEKYLPQQLSEEDLRKKIQELLSQITDKENLGKVMGKIMGELKSQADGALVKKIVEEEIKK